MNASVAQLNDSHPVALKSRYPTSAPTTDASDPTDTMRVSASAIMNAATALAHAGVATKSSAPNPVATPRPPRPRSVIGQQWPDTAATAATASASGRPALASGKT